MMNVKPIIFLILSIHGPDFGRLARNPLNVPAKSKSVLIPSAKTRISTPPENKSFLAAICNSTPPGPGPCKGPQ